MLQKITEMIYLVFVQYMKHRMQIMQERWEYVVFVTNTYCSTPIW